MSTPALASLRGLAYALGELRPIEELSPVASRPELLESLHAKGLRGYARSSVRAIELAQQSAEATLRAADVPPHQVDALVYATMSFWDRPRYVETDVTWLLHSLGLENAQPIGIFLPGCANGCSALRVALGLVLAEGCRQVLVVTADSVDPGDEAQRIMWPDVSVLSDGAASFVVSAAGAGDFDVMAMGFHSAPEMWDLAVDTNLPAFLMGTFRGTQRAARKVLAGAGVEPSQVRALLTNNYNRPVMEMLGGGCGFAEPQLFLDNVERFAHAFAADSLVNLADLAAREPLQPGELVCLLGTGHKNWGAALLRTT